MKNYTVIDNCPITGDAEYIKYLDLGLIPIVNNLCTDMESSLKCEKYPLELIFHKKSCLTSLSISIDPNILYKNYLYKSGVSIPYTTHCNTIYDCLNIKNNMSILDIGGNDGTLLKVFNEVNHTLDLLNIDASENLVELSKLNGINSQCDFWNYGVALSINKKFDRIISTNVFQHVSFIDSFVKGISYALKTDGIWCLEFPYWKNTMDTNQYDQIYHEHMYYYNITPLQLLFNKYGLYISDIQEIEIHGGSMRLLIKKEKDTINRDKIESYIFKEKQSIDSYTSWNVDIQTHIQNSRKFILDIKKSGKKIFGIGASAKGCVFLNVNQLDYNTIDYIIDDTDIKQNKFVPGTGIQVVDISILNTISPDYIILLSHNFSDFFVQSLPEYKGKFIKFFPFTEIL